MKSHSVINWIRAQECVVIIQNTDLFVVLVEHFDGHSTSLCTSEEFQLSLIAKQHLTLD